MKPIPVARSSIALAMPIPVAVAMASLALLAPRAHAQDLIVQAKTIVVAADTILTDGAVLVRQGKVAYVGADIPADARTRAKVVDYGNATVLPGFVLAQTTLGQEPDLAEGSIAFTPDLRAAEAFDPWEERLLQLSSHGVTAFALSPSPRNVAGGIAALGKPGKDRGTLVATDLHLVLSLTAAARNPERQPTSLMGAMDLLRTTLTAARTGTQTGPDAVVLQQVLQGSRAVFVHADTFAELNAALDLSRDFGLSIVLVGAREAGKVLPRIVQQKAGIVLDSRDPDGRLADLRLPVRLAEAGVPFCFGGNPARLRLSAVLAVKNGLDRSTALQALTRMPAVLLDQQANLGSLRQGAAADFVVFDGDPLDLDAAHLATWIDGVRVHGAEPAGKPSLPPSSTAAAGER